MAMIVSANQGLVYGLHFLVPFKTVVTFIKYKYNQVQYNFYKVNGFGSVILGERESPRFGLIDRHATLIDSLQPPLAHYQF